jgi:hypothetical protein
VKNRGDNFLSDAESSEYLVLLHGKKVKSLKELSDSLKNMPDSIFGYHVNFQKNDFSNWIRYALNDKKLASSVSKAKTKQKMIKVIDKRIDEKESIKIKEKKQMKKAEKKQDKKPKKKIKETKNKFNKLSKNKKTFSDSRKVPNALNKVKNLESLRALNEILERERVILEKERETDARERKIQEIEKRIEERLNNTLEKEKQKNHVFSKDFFQGMIVSILLVAIAVMIYWKFFIS